MGTFFVYILKSSICLAFFYMFYRLLLSRETFHRFNRIALLGILCLSLLIPFCEVSTKEPQTVAMIDWQQLLLMVNSPGTPVIMEAPSISWSEIVLLIYLIGLLFFFCRNLYSLANVVRLLKAGQRKTLENGIILIVHQNHKIAPFSWMKYVVISDVDLQESGREILIHEIAHIQNRHSIDLLLAEFCIFFHWFNPAAWLMKQELQNIHEYEADETVINQGVDAKQYQLLLIKKAVGTRLYSMANSFNHSKLKKRITMMLKEKSNPWARLKYLYILPMAALAVTAFARPEISEKLDEVSAVEINDLSAIVKGNSGNIIPKQANAVSQDAAKPIIRDTVRLNNQTVACDTAASIYGSGQHPLVLLNGKEVVFGSKESSFEAGSCPLIIVDGKEVSNDKLIRVRARTISVLKGKNATDLYGERAKDGVVQVYTKDAEESTSNVIGLDPANQPLVIVDGKETPYEDIKKTSPDRIKSVSVLKDKTGTTVYGDKGKNGVILIETKDAISSKIQDINVSATASQEKQSAQRDTEVSLVKSLILVDGKVTTMKELDRIDPDRIKSVSVLKDKKAIALYGDKGKNGVTLIELKTTKEMQDSITPHFKKGVKFTPPKVAKDKKTK